MANRYIITAIFLIILTTEVTPQLFDFYQGLQPFFQTTLRPIRYYQSTRRPTPIRPEKASEDPEDSREIRGKRRKTTSHSDTTVKPSRRTKKPLPNDVNLANAIAEKGFQKDVLVEKPKNDRKDTRYQTENPFKTQNPFVNIPGVRPAVVDVNRPPITNRPATQKPHLIVYPKPASPGAIVYQDDDVAPNVLIGVDEENMGVAERRRYIELSERMCDRYKSLNVRHVEAIPLVPSPEPIKVNVSSCAPNTIPLVVGGKVVTINEFPHMALMGWMKIQARGYSWKCGGSLISDQYVLTAGHCSYQERDNTVVTGPPRAVQLGSSYLDDPGALVMKVLSVIRHPKYKLPKSYYDLAIVKLVRPITFSEVIKPACLGETPQVGEPIIATGWGRTEFGGDQSLELRSVSLPIWGLEDCREVLGTSRKLPNGVSGASQICAGEKRGGKDTCQGDSGGPAQIQDGCVWRVVAVTSLGRSCGAPHTPGLYAKVQRAFISATVFGQKIGNDNANINNNVYNNGNSNNNDRNINNNDRNVNNNRNNDNRYTSGNTNNSNNRNTNNNYNNRNTNTYVNTDNPSNNRNNMNSNYNNRNGNNNGNTYNNRQDRTDGVYNNDSRFNNNGNRNNNRNNNGNLYNDRGTQDFVIYTTPRVWWSR